MMESYHFNIALNPRDSRWVPGTTKYSGWCFCITLFEDGVYRANEACNNCKGEGIMPIPPSEVYK